MGKESYKVEKDNFEGSNVCEGCPKIVQRQSFPSTQCGTYSKEGQAMRQKAGYCPVSNRWANWREDKPVVKQGKKRIGQQKQR